MRYSLAIDTATMRGSVGIAQRDGATIVHELPYGLHSASLATRVGALLEDRGATLDDLDCIALLEGPGSFTGLRIGFAWAKGVAFARGTSIVLVSVHDALGRIHRSTVRTIVTIAQSERGHVEAAVRSGAAVPQGGGVDVVAEDRLTEWIRRFGDDPAQVAVAPATDALAALPQLEGFRILSRIPLGGAVAEIGLERLREGLIADLVHAAPRYGRSPNARRPSP